MATKTPLRFMLAIAVVLATMSIAMPALVEAHLRWPGRGAPEVDPSTVSSAMALALGGVAMLRDKLRRR